LTDTTALDLEERRLTDEGEIVLGLIKKAVTENASRALDQSEYGRRYADLIAWFE